MSTDQINTHKVATTATLALSIYGNVKYLIAHHHHGNTPFSSNIIVIFVFWGILYFFQISFVAQIFYPSPQSTPGSAISAVANRLEVTNLVGWHFSIFNGLSFLWAYLFAKEHFFLSELVLGINFINIILLYFTHKTYSIKPLSSWILIHIPTAAFPLSWLIYAIFWNGAILFHAHHLFGRIVANILIWDFLIIPAFFLFVFNDYGVGFSSSLITFGLGLGQLFTKVIAFQWIFAFIISGVLFVLSTFAAATGSLTPQGNTSSEAAPLLQA